MTFYVNKGSDHNLIITFDYSPERVKKIRQVTVSAIKFACKHVIKSNNVNNISVPRPKKVE